MCGTKLTGPKTTVCTTFFRQNGQGRKWPRVKMIGAKMIDKKFAFQVQK